MNQPIRVAFYLNNALNPTADFRNPRKGNPGVGATVYLFTALPWYLVQSSRSAEVSLKLFASHAQYLPSEYESEQADSFAEAVRKAEDQGYQLFVFRPTDDSTDYQTLDRSNLAGIAWTHNHLWAATLKRMMNCSALKRNVMVGYEQIHRIRDCRLFEISTVILNGYDVSQFPDTHADQKQHVVGYIGSLTPGKGFHVVAQAWPAILQEVTDAKLWVIGSGQLYNEQAKMGKWGVAEEAYERRFRPFISTPDGDIDPSVKFLGTIGQEKLEILRKIQIGVVNPTGRTECCPVSTLDFQACGIPVVSTAKLGLLDTVEHRTTGLLGRRQRDLAGNVARLLKDDELRMQYGKQAREFVKTRFDWSPICDQWLDQFQQVATGEPPALVNIDRHWTKELKWFRELNRRFKNVTGAHWLPSLVDVESRLIALLRR